MRKVAAVFLAISIITILAACGKKEEPDTSSSVSLDVSVSDSTSQVTTTEPEQLTYVLTTAADKTVPWENTTRFEIVPVTTTQPSTEPEPSTESLSDFTLTPSDIDAPPVITDVATTDRTTTQPPTAPSDFTNNTTTERTTAERTTTERTTAERTTRPTTQKPTTTRPTTQKTTVRKTAKSLAIESSGYNSNTNCIILDVSSDGWSSDFKGTRTSATVIVDGQTLSAPCKVPSSKNADGRYEVQIDLSDLGISSGSTVSYTIGEGAIQTKAGTQYNSTYTGSCDVS